MSAARSRKLTVLGLLAVLSILLTAGRPAAAAQESAEAGDIRRLNKQALDAFDNLNFDQSKALLEQALTEADSAGLAKDPLAARTHMHLGMLMIAGFQKHDDAVDQFRMALKIQPDVTPTPGLFNPEVQAAFDETKALVRAEPPARQSPQTSRPASTRPASQASSGEGRGGGQAASSPPSQDEAEATGGADGSLLGSALLLSLGIGSGFGTAKGHLDANTAVTHTAGGVGPSDNSWSGGIAASRLAHLSLGVGYFIAPNLLVGLDGRLQLITGTTSAPMKSVTVAGVSPPSSAIAVFARANWYLTRGPIRPFISGGLGIGTIRQVVTLPEVTTGKNISDCGASGHEQCVDTVTGGPLWLAAGGGVAYELGSFALLANLTANVGIPKWMLNIDVLVGVGMHL